MHLAFKGLYLALSLGKIRKVKIPGASPEAFDKTPASSPDRHALHTQPHASDQAEASLYVPLRE